MDQKKIGIFLKELRKEKGLTQERLSEKFDVSSRTVSRWETGRNMPDLQIIIELAKFYKVDIEELLDGKRKGEIMDKGLKTRVEKIADYSYYEKIELLKRVNKIFICGFFSFISYFIMLVFEPSSKTNLYDFILGLMLGVSFGAIIIGIIVTSKNLNKYLRKFAKAKDKLLKNEI